jgi:hypothetical protein
VVGPAGRRDDEAMVAPAKVWMVRLDRGGDLREVEGTQRMAEDAVVFVDPGNRSELRVPFAATQKVRRVLGSPVLVIVWRNGETRSETAFYFVKPPPLRTDRAATAQARPTPADARPSIGSILGRSSKRKERRESIRYLAARSGTTKTTIRAWAQEIRARTRP